MSDRIKREEKSMYSILFIGAKNKFHTLNTCSCGKVKAPTPTAKKNTNQQHASPDEIQSNAESKNKSDKNTHTLRRFTFA